MSDGTAIAHASFTSITEPAPAIPVQFNPASLQYTVTNTLKEEGKGNTKKQFVTQSTAKLTMDLVFDTTHSGQDVRTLTAPLERFMEPIGGSPGSAQRAPAVVEFEWGTYAFRGMVESYKETVDFFAPGGVPLRATVNLTLARQDKVFEPGPQPKADTPEARREPVVVPTAGGGQFATQLGVTIGDPRAGRAIAAANGQESMRFSAGAALSVDAAIELGPPVAFASGGAGFGFGAGGGAAVGGRASAGVSASAGAFAGLRAAPPVRASLDVERLIQRSETVRLGADAKAGFALGGQASVEGSASLSADVGASASLRSRIQFEEE
jgi:hypothetical protein